MLSGPEEPEEAEASGPEDAGRETPPQLKSTPPAQAAETEGDAGSSPSSPALAEHEQEGQLTATPADEEASPLMQQFSAKDAAAQTGPQPWPLPPRVVAAQSAARASEATPEEAAPEQALPKLAAEAAPKEDALAQAKPRLPPSNLVTSWGPSAPARRIMAHTAPGPHSMLASSSGAPSAYLVPSLKLPLRMPLHIYKYFISIRVAPDAGERKVCMLDGDAFRPASQGIDKPTHLLEKEFLFAS